MSKKFLQPSIIVSSLSLLVAIITAVPGFISLEKAVSKIYWSESYSELKIPKEIDTKEISTLMISRGIPRSTWDLEYLNQGNSSCEKLKIEVKTPNKFMSLNLIPDNSEEQIWINYDSVKILDDSTRVIVTVSEFATKQKATYHVLRCQRRPPSRLKIRNCIPSFPSTSRQVSRRS